jgi:hypothetical protein
MRYWAFNPTHFMASTSWWDVLDATSRTNFRFSCVLCFPQAHWKSFTGPKFVGKINRRFQASTFYNLVFYHLLLRRFPQRWPTASPTSYTLRRSYSNTYPFFHRAELFLKQSSLPFIRASHQTIPPRLILIYILNLVKTNLIHLLGLST